MIDIKIIKKLKPKDVLYYITGRQLKKYIVIESYKANKGYYGVSGYIVVSDFKTDKVSSFNISPSIRKNLYLELKEAFILTENHLKRDVNSYRQYYSDSLKHLKDFYTDFYNEVNK